MRGRRNSYETDALLMLIPDRQTERDPCLLLQFALRHVPDANAIYKEDLKKRSDCGSKMGLPRQHFMQYSCSQRLSVFFSESKHMQDIRCGYMTYYFARGWFRIVHTSNPAI